MTPARLAITAMASVLAITACSLLAQADDGGETARTIEYLSQHQHVGVMVEWADEPFIPDAMRQGAMLVLPCENRELDPRAVSSTGDTGLWQVNGYWQRDRITRMGFTPDDMLAAGPNTQVAVAIWSEQGFTPWSCRP